MFDGNLFRPHGILPTFQVQLGGKIVAFKVEVVDAPLDYNILFGCNWIYIMTVFMSSMFHVLYFPREGNIVMIDYLSHAPVTLHRWDPLCPLSRILRRKLRTLVSKCILPLWEPLISRRQSCILMSFPMNPHHHWILSHSALHISMTHGLYLFRLCHMKVIFTWEWKCCYLLLRFHIRLSRKPLQTRIPPLHGWKRWIMS